MFKWVSCSAAKEESLEVANSKRHPQKRRDSFVTPAAFSFCRLLSMNSSLLIQKMKRFFCWMFDLQYDFYLKERIYHRQPSLNNDNSINPMHPFHSIHSNPLHYISTTLIWHGILVECNWTKNELWQMLYLCDRLNQF